MGALMGLETSQEWLKNRNSLMQSTFQSLTADGGLCYFEQCTLK